MVESVVQSHAEIVVGSDEKKLIRVLHVDDELGLLKVAKQCLELQGPFHVDTASSVEEALNKLKEKEYDAVVSDYKMPGKDGLEFLEELRKSGNSIPFILFTGKGREEVIIRALNLGADHYVNKNGDHEIVYAELKHVISEVVGTRKAESELQESQMRYRNLIENAPDVVYTISENGTLASLNSVFERLTGWKCSEWIGKSFASLVHPDDLNTAMETFEKALRGECLPPYELRVLSKSGKYLTGEFTSTPWVEKGEIVGELGIVRDVTGRKKAEEALRQSEERYRSLFDNAKDIIVTFDLKGNVTSINKAIEKYSAKKDEIVGKKMLKFVPKKYWPRILKDLVELAQGKSVEGESEVITPKGKRIVEYRANPIRQGKKVIGVQEILIDITERKRAEEALRESEEKYRKQFEEALDAIFLADAETGIILDCNRAAAELVGRERSELVGKHQRILHPPEKIKGEFSTTFKQHLKEKEGRVLETQVITKNGEIKDVAIKATLFELQGKKTLQGTFRDITERNKVEKAILESQQKFEGLFRHNPEAAVYLDLLFKIVDVNPRFCHLFGYSAEEGKGMNINKIIVPENNMEEAEKLDKDAKNGYASHNTVRKRKDGSLVHVSISACPVTVEGKLSGYVALYKDITELKDAEERLKETNKKLQGSNEKLQVVGGLTRHDVRNKLSAVTGNAYLLRRTLAGNAEALEQLTDMETAIRLVEEIFEFAKTYEKLGIEQLTNVSVDKAVDEAASLFPDLKGVRIVNECHGLTVLSDSLLCALFYNLIDNSLKHGEKLSQIRIHYEKAEENQLRLVYEDDGVGISRDAKSKLFTEDFTTGKGSGHGLYLVKKMMDVYGWAIQETGTPGKGVHFTMVMPEKNQNGKENYQLH